MKLSTQAPGSSVRRAFTLIELLIVISIIGLMTGLIVAGAMKFKDAAVNHAVDSQVTKYQRALDSEYQLVVEKCHKEGPPPAVLAFCGNDPDRARAVHIAATLKINFPDNFADALTSFSITSPTTGEVYWYRAKNTFASVNGATAPTVTRTPAIAAADYERAVLLYLIVKEKATAGTGADTDANGEQRTEQFGTKSLSYLIDGFGYPLVYSRWFQSAEVNQPPYTSASPLSKDPLDPKNLVASWGTNANGLNVAPYNLGFNGQNRLPTVISFGRNKTNDGAAAGSDDRVGYRLARFGAKGDGK